MKRVTVEVKSIVVLTLGDDESVNNSMLASVKPTSVKDFTTVKEEPMGDEPSWVVYYNKQCDVLLQMVIGSGANLSDDDGETVNGEWVEYDRDIVGSSYIVEPSLAQYIIDGELTVDGSYDGELTVGDKPVELEDHQPQWVGFAHRMGMLGSRECLDGYLDICGWRTDNLDDWKLVAQG